MSDDNLANYLAGAANTKSHPLDRFTNRIVTNMLMKFCIPWLSSCLQKYSETEFHMRMSDPYFDFIDDWYSNHPNKYNAFIKAARKMRHRYTYDPEAVTQRVRYVLETRAGWTVYDHELIKLRD